jgi:hypothetical protein
LAADTLTCNSPVTLLLLLLLSLAGGFGYRQPDNTTDKQAPSSPSSSAQQQQPAVEAMSLYINPPNTPTPGNSAIDALYEADHPAFQSRMQGKWDRLDECTQILSDALLLPWCSVWQMGCMCVMVAHPLLADMLSVAVVVHSLCTALNMTHC